MKFIPVLSTMLFFVMSGTALRSSHDPTLEGVWLHSNERIQVEIAPCGENLCGKIVWLKNPKDETGRPRTDRKNLDQTKRAQPLMGMTVIRGLVRSGPRLWTDGTIYNPDDGKIYSGRLVLVDPDTVKIRAYKFLTLFGETQVWTRVKD
jgi:uncharacterized protein (DUF2147 family)